MTVRARKFIITSSTLVCMISTAMQTASNRIKTTACMKLVKKATNQCSNFQGWFVVYFIILKAAFISSSWLMWRKKPQMKRLMTTAMSFSGVLKEESLKTVIQRKVIKHIWEIIRKTNLLSIEFLAALNLFFQSSIISSSSSWSSVYSYSYSTSFSSKVYN